MQPNAGQGASGRPAAFDFLLAMLVALFSFLPGLPAQAGDRSLIDFIGFSEDFRYFAFEEFGIQDGSGFAFSNIYVVDLDTDSWVVGTPIRVLAQSEARPLADVRAEAAGRVADHVSEFGMDVPVEIAALLGDGVPDIDGQTIGFGAPGISPGEVSGRYELSLEQFDTAAASPCADWFGVQPKGYALTLSDAGVSREVHRDGDLPRSRGCPLDYRLYAVVMPFGGATLSNAVAIVSVYPGGFEGPDRRFLAVPLGL